MTTPAALHLSRDLALPLNAVTQTFAFIARRGAGKTYAASKLAEQMLLAHMQIVVLDPVGNWYGLRLAADGRSRGFEIPVFGGEHGDLPLAVGAGALVADLVVDRAVSLVLDLSSFRKGERKTFVTDFAEQFFHRKKTARTPVHVFVEEAQVFVPERPAKGEERMLGAFVDLVRLGRNYGIGISLISQRPQSVSKEALNQTEALLVLQTGGAHERKALAEWIVYQGIESKDVLSEVPALPAGTAYLWSPQWLSVLQKIKIDRKITFDASATPELGAKAVEPKTLAPVDLQAIRDAMQTVVEEAKANDPRALKAQIVDLQRQLRTRPATAARVEVKETRVEIPVFKDGEVGRLESAVTQLGVIGGQLVTAGNQVRSAADEIAERLRLFNQRPAPPRPQVVTRTTAAARPVPKSTPAGAGTGPARTRTGDRTGAYGNTSWNPRRQDDGGSSKSVEPGSWNPRRAGRSSLAGLGVTVPQQRILDALAWLESIGVGRAVKTQLALLAEQSPTSSGYTNNLGSLRTAGLIVYPGPAECQLTDAGRAVASVPDAPPTTAELQRQVLARLPKPKAAILQALIDAYPEAVAKDELASRAGQSPTSSGYTNNLGSLRSLGLIDYPAPGQAVARGVLFLET